MAITLAQHAVPSPGSGSLTCAYTSPNTAKNLLVIAINYQWTGSDPGVSVSDNAGNTWLKAFAEQSTGIGSTSVIFYCLSCKAASAGNTVTFAGPNASDASPWLTEWFSAGATWAFDTANGSDISTSTPSVELTLANNNELIFSTYEDPSGSGVPTHGAGQIASDIVDSGGPSGLDQYAIPTSNGNYTTSANNAVTQVCVMVAAAFYVTTTPTPNDPVFFAMNS
jgi:hypothetical protein